MELRDLVPWNNRSSNATAHGGESGNPFFALHREMNRLFEDTFRNLDRPFGSPSLGWPNIEIDDGDKEIRVMAELPGLDQKDVNVELANGTLTISGEKKSETEDKGRLFSERYYGRFERRIAVDDVEQDKAAASFKNGLLTITLPKALTAQQKVKRIAINGK
ncbi:HSP20 family protein [Tardiphaga robiniae]|uniref:Hsp20/alpha crystallin family protein n=1 Tax=Tardiphaga robiniae TaxID=943830 RepID=UPI00285979C3|nr:Hsp20/alpha crystallin family protein [Tardiphaga robiniae]MDR6659034.1 HSP20 family protein [Tardiphaga robiniae]